MEDQKAITQTSPVPSPRGNYCTVFFYVNQPFPFSIHENLANNPIESISGTYILCFLSELEAQVWLPDTGMPLHPVLC